MSFGPELTRRVAIDPWPRDAIDVAFEAADSERSALARRFAIPEVRELTARCRLTPAQASGVLVCTGVIEAVVVQTCVVSLEPVVDSISTTFERHLTRTPGQGAIGNDQVDPEATELEPFEGEGIDVGEIVAEELALALDPYPHAQNAYEGLDQLGPSLTFGEDARPERPFAALGRLAR